MAAPIVDVLHVPRNTQAAETGTYQLGIDVIVYIFLEAEPDSSVGNGLAQEVPPGIRKSNFICFERRHFRTNVHDCHDRPSVAAKDVCRRRCPGKYLERRREQVIRIGEIGGQRNGVTNPGSGYTLAFDMLKRLFIQNDGGVIVYLRMLTEVRSDGERTLPRERELKQAGILNTTGGDCDPVPEYFCGSCSIPG